MGQQAYGDSKLIINQVRRKYEVGHEDLISYHNATINMAEELKSFYINHVPRQQTHEDALVSFVASLALPAGATEKVLVYSHHLYCSKFAFEDNQTLERGLQVKEVFEISTGLKLRDW